MHKYKSYNPMSDIQEYVYIHCYNHTDLQNKQYIQLFCPLIVKSSNDPGFVMFTDKYPLISNLFLGL